MKSRATKKTNKRYPGPKEQAALPAKGRRLLRKGVGKKRAAISPSELHSKSFGH